MTNNEAAKWIQLYIDLAKFDPTTGEAAYLNDDDKKTIEAMEMAINALTAETHEKRTETHSCDCVERQVAISLPVKPKEDRYFQTQNLDDAFELGWFACQKCIEDLLSAQPELPQRTGRWIEHNPHKWGLGIVFECSECGEKIDCEPSNYCPNCDDERR